MHYYLHSFQLRISHSVCSDSSDDFFTVINGPYIPLQPSGPSIGRPEINYYFNTSTTHHADWDISYQFNWGQGNYSDWIGPFPSGEQVTLGHKWNKKGTYFVKVRAKDYKHYEKETKWSESHEIIIYENPPEKPIIVGSASGATWKVYLFNISSIDPDGDEVFYFRITFFLPEGIRRDND